MQQNKICTRCDVEKPATAEYFSRKKSHKSGLKFTCKECIKKDYHKNRDKILETNKKYYEENKQEISAKAKKYREENKETVKQRKKKYYEENKDEISERGKKYRETLSLDKKQEISARAKKKHAAKNYPTINDENILKSCQICKEQKPSTTEHFSKCKSQEDGLAPICKPCRSEQRRNLNFKPLNAPNVLKPCSKCKIEKPATTEYFHLNNTMKLGLNSSCKECANNDEDRKLKGKEYYKNNKDVIRAFIFITM